MTQRDPTTSVHPAPHPLRSTLGLLEREATRRAKGTHPGMMRLADAELGALLELLRREVGAAPAGAEDGAPHER